MVKIIFLLLFIMMANQESGKCQGILKKIKSTIEKGAQKVLPNKPNPPATTKDAGADQKQTDANGDNNPKTASDPKNTGIDTSFFVASPKMQQVNGFIPFKDKLIIVYNSIRGSEDTIGTQLMEFDGTNFREIKSPLTHTSFTGQSAIYNEKLTLQFQALNSDGSIHYKMAIYDGVSLSFIPDLVDPQNPALMGYLGSPIEYNHILYVMYNNGIGLSTHIHNKLAKFNGKNFEIIKDIGGEYEGSPFVYKNKLYFSVREGGYRSLGVYDGIKTKTIPVGPKGYAGSHFIYNDKLYLTCLGISNSGGFASYLAILNGDKADLINNLSSIKDLEFSGPIPFNGKLYFVTRSNTMPPQFATFDGNILNLIPFQIDNSKRQFGNNFVPDFKPPFFELNKKLFFIYATGSVGEKLVQFDGSTISMVVHPSLGSPTYGIMYRNGFHIMYYVYTGTNSKGAPEGMTYLYKFDGLNFSLIDQKKLAGISVVYNNKLYSWGSIWDGVKYIPVYWVW